MSGRGVTLRQLVVNIEAWGAVWVLVRSLLEQERRVLVVVQRERGPSQPDLRTDLPDDLRLSVLHLPESEFVGAVKLAKVLGMEHLVFLWDRPGLWQRPVGRHALCFQISRAERSDEEFGQELLSLVTLASKRDRWMVWVEAFDESQLTLEERRFQPRKS